MPTATTSPRALPPHALRSSGLTFHASWHLCAALGVLVFCLLAGSKLLGDPDTQWHIAAGRWMIEHHSMPRTDFLSYTFEGRPWIAKEWLSQLLLAIAWMLGSWPAVALLAALAVAAAVFIIAADVGKRSTAAGGVAFGLLAFVVLAPTTVARPHLLVFPIVAAWTVMLLQSAQTTRRPPWHSLPLLVLWANMHAGFTMGFVIAAAMGLHALIGSAPSERIGTAIRWFGFGIACLAAVLVTPYGIEPLLINATMAGGNEAMQYIGEWNSASLTPRWVGLVSLVAVCLYALSREARTNAALLVLVAFLAFAMMRHERFVMVFGIVAPIVAGPAICDMAKDLFRRLSLFQDAAILPAAISSRRVAAGLASIAVAAGWLMPPMPPARVAPVAALASVPAELRAELRTERVFNSYDLGGFLANNGVKTFIDGRTDQLFLGGFMTRMMTAAAAKDPSSLEALLNEHKVSWALIGAQSPEARLFPRMSGWKLLHNDDAAHVYVRGR